MEHIMIDIETLGTKPNSVILSISAVGFDLTTGNIDDIFHIDINIDSCTDVGLKIDADTIVWWFKQDESARKKLTETPGHPIKNALRRFTFFLEQNFPKDVKVWGNSARFDLGILEAAYTACKYVIPWNHYNERDVRTLVSFKPEIKENQIKFEGIKHYGIDDCKHQIKYCCETWKHLNK